MVSGSRNRYNLSTSLNTLLLRLSTDKPRSMRLLIFYHHHVSYAIIYCFRDKPYEVSTTTD